MNFAEFQNQSRLYVIGALESDEVDKFELERTKLGKKAEHFITECYALYEAFALSLRSAKASAAIKERLMSRVRSHRNKLTHCDHDRAEVQSIPVPAIICPGEK